MQFLLSVLDDTPTATQTATPTGPPARGTATAEEMAAIDTFNERLREAGHWVFAGGLGTPDTATVVDARAGEAVLTDGPFVETKEFLAGFWVLEAADLDQALALARDASRACHRRVEVRPFLG